MLVFKAKTILNVQPVEAKPYDFQDDEGKRVTGTSIKGVVTAIGEDDRVTVITVKGKTLEEAKKKLDGLKLVQGRPAEIRIEPTVTGGVAQLRV